MKTPTLIQPLIDFRGAWDSAVQRAGLGNLEFHDLRRSGVRNLSRSGVPERVIMSITGRRTRARFIRYNITSEADLNDAAKRIQAYRDAKKGLDSGLNGDKNCDSAKKEEGPQISSTAGDPGWQNSSANCQGLSSEALPSDRSASAVAKQETKLGPTDFPRRTGQTEVAL